MLAAMATLAACNKAPEPPKPPTPVGTWTVVSRSAPGPSAMNDSVAESWIGRIADYRPNGAIFVDDTCVRAQYPVKRVKADSFFQFDFGVEASKLGFNGDSLMWLTSVWCGPEDWRSAGGLLMWLHTDTLFVVKDGEFFELARNPPKP
jgi:hypothetical protein